MMASDLFLLLMLISLLGVGIFVLSALVNLVRRQPVKEEWKRALIFFTLAFVSFILFGLTMT